MVTAKAARRRRRVAVREEYCIGCRLCEVACVTRHSRSRDVVAAHKTESPRPGGGVRFEAAGPVSLAVSCRHCADPLCVEACLTGAMARDPGTGRVVHDPARCVGCWMCVMTCPTGVPRPDPAAHRLAFKCDLCGGDDLPACVAACPNAAAVLVEEDEP
ncbi:MAG: 4Fe-4S dicluster domain-containing protein [Candidatus Coatesbacteria bacterium]